MQYLYCVRAAVGEYTIGTSDMIVPRRKTENEAYDSTVDNVTTPTVFVLFNEHRNYPEYLITFQ